MLLKLDYILIFELHYKLTSLVKNRKQHPQRNLKYNMFEIL